jgi:hypothetical protein
VPLVSILRHDEVAPPGVSLAEACALLLLEEFVDWERHPVPRQDRVVYDIGIFKLLVHPVKHVDDLKREERGESRIDSFD